ncbi:hypothetical protein J5X84_12060 [Streptosporangiaceae bacterium NEAU-GS5]|nr:hypothetical protein [Streptosporangiaceae bacterium NEAU-GS5]
MGSDGFPGPLRAAGVTARELEIFWLVGDRLHNHEIAERLRLSERTVESHVSSLLRKLGGSNRAALIDTATRLRTPRDPGGALPRPLSSFVGRTREIADLSRLVEAHRLLTLTGPAGTGKTRLALRLARATTGMPPAVLVDLARVPPGEPVERAFADALGVSGDAHRLGDLIRGTLAEVPRWLIVDNCEHVATGAAELLAELLASTDRLRVLATSHGPLRVAGEVVYEIPPLDLPGDVADPAAVLAAPAGRLFADRAEAVSPGFAVTADNARHVAMVCRRLDGLPLAIELAAARVRFFTPAELVARLDNRFALLTDGARGAPSRHRTLEEALRWSYDLLGEDERLLFERCSVFPGEFDYDTAAEVLAYPPLGPDDLVLLFPRLLDRSLISRRRRGQITEYRLLDSVRQFAHRRLEAHGAADVAREQHARHHLRHAVAVVPDLRGRDQVAALRWFTGRWPDLRDAMRWALDTKEFGAAWEFFADIGTGWEILGARGELFDWLDRLLDRPLPDGPLGVHAAVTCVIVLCFQNADRARGFADQALERAAGGTAEDRALAELASGWALMHAVPGGAAEGLRRAATMFGELGDEWHRAFAMSGVGVVTDDWTVGLAWQNAAADLFGRLRDNVKRANCLNQMANRAIIEGIRFDDALGWLEEAERLAVGSGNDHERLHAAVFRASLDQRRGDFTTTEERFRALLGDFRRMGDLRCVTRCLRGIGAALAARGDHESAGRLLVEGVEIATGLGDPYAMATGMRLLAETDYATGRLTRAAALLGAADRLTPEDHPLRAELLEQLGPAAFNAPVELMERNGTP